MTSRAAAIEELVCVCMRKMRAWMLPPGLRIVLNKHGCQTNPLLILLLLRSQIILISYNLHLVL